jgi:hypothetical protein
MRPAPAAQKKVLNCFGGAVVAQLLGASTAPVRMQPAAIPLHPLAPVVSISAECNKSERRAGGILSSGPCRPAGRNLFPELPYSVNRRFTMKLSARSYGLRSQRAAAFVNITGQVADCLRESGVREAVLVNAMHITASVFINDDESGLHKDYDKWLEALAPHEPVSQYLHNRTGG